uniref:AP2/ERF domain-containing protein n=1 Tax=Tanacetum cinerariifolium TaxID=118510 RepID=A0A6L2M0R7_TANCI|nr:hypothetical protein [Tanacetum cinerariifolium]
MAENQENVSNKNIETRGKVVPTKQNIHTRTVRIILHDPDMTDDSSDDDANKRPKSKTITREIKMPMVTFSDTNESSQNSNDGVVKYRGVRQRKSGKWAAEIRNPIERRRVWLGTYNTAKEASIAYEIKKLEFEKIGKASYGFIKSNNALDEDLLPDQGLIMDPNKMTLEDAGKDLDLGTMELGASFLDCFDGALNGFGNVDEFNLCGLNLKQLYGILRCQWLHFRINESSQNSNDRMRNLVKKPRGLTRTSSQPKVPITSDGVVKYRGVRQRKSGKWAAEIRNPIERRRIWLGLIMDPNEMTLEDAGKDLDLGTMELGASFLDCFDGALNGFGNVDDFNLCGFDEKMSSDFPDWDFDSRNVYLSKMAYSTCIYLLNRADSRWKNSKEELILCQQVVECDWGSGKALDYLFTTNFAVALLLLYSAEYHLLLENGFNAFEAKGYTKILKLIGFVIVYDFMETKKIEFEKMEKASYGFVKSNNALDEDLLPDRGLIMDPNEMTLEEAGKNLDLGTMELGYSFLDCFDGALNGFGNVDEFNLCGFDEKMSSDLPDWDFGEFDDEERAWFDALELDE